MSPEQMQQDRIEMLKERKLYHLVNMYSYITEKAKTLGNTSLSAGERGLCEKVVDILYKEASEMLRDK